MGSKRLVNFCFDFLFPTIPSTRLCAGRIVFYFSILFFYSYAGEALYDFTKLPDSYWHPISIFKLLPRIFPNESQAKYLFTLWKFSLIVCALGISTKFFTKLSFLLSLFVLGMAQNFGLVNHETHMPVIFMAIMAIAPCGDHFSLDALLNYYFKRQQISPYGYGWPIQMMYFTTALIYFEAAYQKIHQSGLEWISAENMQGILLRCSTVTELGIKLSENSYLCLFSSFAIITTQFSMILSLFIRKLRPYSILGIILFHFFSYLLMGRMGNFLGYLSCFIFFIPFERYLYPIFKGLKTGHKHL